MGMPSTSLAFYPIAAFTNSRNSGAGASSRDVMFRPQRLKPRLWEAPSRPASTRWVHEGGPRARYSRDLSRWGWGCPLPPSHFIPSPPSRTPETAAPVRPAWTSRFRLQRWKPRLRDAPSRPASTRGVREGGPRARHSRDLSRWGWGCPLPPSHFIPSPPSRTPRTTAPVPPAGMSTPDGTGSRRNMDAPGAP